MVGVRVIRFFFAWGKVQIWGWGGGTFAMITKFQQKKTILDFQCRYLFTLGRTEKDYSK